MSSTSPEGRPGHRLPTTLGAKGPHLAERRKQADGGSASGHAALLKRVQQGESVVVTKDGEPVARVIRLRRTPLHRDQLLRRWAKLPQIDAEQFRHDVDEILAWSL